MHAVFGADELEVDWQVVDYNKEVTTKAGVVNKEENEGLVVEEIAREETVFFTKVVLYGCEGEGGGYIDDVESDHAVVLQRINRAAKGKYHGEFSTRSPGKSSFTLNAFDTVYP